MSLHSIMFELYIGTLVRLPSPFEINLKIQRFHRQIRPIIIFYNIPTGLNVSLKRSRQLDTGFMERVLLFFTVLP